MNRDDLGEGHAASLRRIGTRRRLPVLCLGLFAVGTASAIEGFAATISDHPAFAASWHLRRLPCQVSEQLVKHPHQLILRDSYCVCGLLTKAGNLLQLCQQ